MPMTRSIWRRSGWPNSVFRRSAGPLKRSSTRAETTNHREGVLWNQPSQCDLLFITLNKRKALFSPTTRTRDLALGPSLFHWESQSNTRADSATGQRTIHHASRGSPVLLFVREARGFHAAGHRKEGGRAGGVTEPSRCLGFATYEGSRG